VESDLHHINAVDVLQRAKRSTRAAEVALRSPNNNMMNSGEIDLSDDSLREPERSATKTPQGSAVLEYARVQQAKATRLISPPPTRNDLAHVKEERWSIKLSEQLRSDAEGQLRKVDQLLRYSPMKVKCVGAGENQRHPGVGPQWTEPRPGMIGEREGPADEDWSQYLGGSALLVEDLAATRPPGRGDAMPSHAHGHVPTTIDARIRPSQPRQTWSPGRPSREEVDALELNENNTTANRRKPPRLRIWSPVHGNQRLNGDLEAKIENKSHADANPSFISVANERTGAGHAPNSNAQDAQNHTRNFGASSTHVHDSMRDMSTRASGYRYGGLASVLRYQDDESEQYDTRQAMPSTEKQASSQREMAQSSCDHETLASVLRYHDDHDSSQSKSVGENYAVHDGQDFREASETFDDAREDGIYEEQGGTGARRVRGYAERLALLDKEIQEKEKEAEFLQDEVRACDFSV
jgi:hypothetical protein